MALVHRFRMGLQQPAQIGVEVGGALLGLSQDDVARRVDPGQNMQSGDAGGASADVIGVETVSYSQRLGTAGAREGALIDPGEGLAAR